MIMVKHNYKKTCFYCMYDYEIHDNKTSRYILYNGLKRIVCRHCTYRKHKPLNKKYEGFDTQCTTCKKPVKYNKCLACSLCDHFVHGKCCNLNTSDISAIEDKCDFFICQKCSKDTFPNFIATETKTNRKNRQNHKNCLTCTNIIQGHHYPNKQAIYNMANLFNFVCLVVMTGLV